MSFLALAEPIRSTMQRLDDLMQMAVRKYEPQFSLFIDAETMQIAKQYIRTTDFDFEIGYFGGYDDAERCMFGIWPAYEQDLDAIVPISLIRIDYPAMKTLSHRDCLGSLLGLGIKREMLGDILCEEGRFYVFVRESMASYILNNLEKIGSVGVKTALMPISDFAAPQPKTETKGVFIMSNRLDAILAAALDLSRSKASDLIHAERVKVNHSLKTQVDVHLNEGDLLSVQGFGRLKVGGFGNKSRKGRTYLEIIRFI